MDKATFRKIGKSQATVSYHAMIANIANLSADDEQLADDKEFSKALWTCLQGSICAMCHVLEHFDIIGGTEPELLSDLAWKSFKQHFQEVMQIRKLASKAEAKP